VDRRAAKHELLTNAAVNVALMPFHMEMDAFITETICLRELTVETIPLE